MLKQFFPIVFLITSVLVSCGTEATEKPTDQTNSANPLLNGSIKSKPSKLYSTTYDGADLVYSFDPENETISVRISSRDDDNNQYVVLTGSFDPETGETTYKSCEGYCSETSLGEFLTLIWFNNDVYQEYLGEGQVVVSAEGIGYFGVNPTSPDNMPGGRSTYLGSVVMNYQEYDPDLDDYDYVISAGEATTTVNFDTGDMSATFQNFEGELAGASGSVTGIQIDGTYFSGGEIVFVTPEGNVLKEDGSTETDTYGRFFGDNGEELGGSINFEDYGDNSPIFLYGDWNGVRK